MESSIRQRANVLNDSYHRKNLYDNGDFKTENPKKYSPLNALIVVPLILLFHLILILHVHHRLNSFPLPLSIQNSRSTDFVEERVRIILDDIVNLGPRATGSEANINARDVILNVIEEIKKDADPVHLITVEQQNVDGEFAIDFLEAGHFTNVYQNINNIMVKFTRKESPSNHSILMNCHYDSVINSPGASDDAVSCCVMLELLRSFSRHAQPFKHNIIFLFNGAEENILQASHGFITKHEWGKSIRAFVNLEATGAGGWEMVFQTGPENPWLILNYIKSVKYPSASIVSQEVFQTGKIPGDTDFRIFRDYGHIPGIDIAHIKYGYVYHTQNDLPRYIQPGCIQRGGENLFDLVKSLISNDELVDPGPQKHGNIVFYDFIGYFMIYYPMRMAVILNIGIASLFLLVIFRKINGHNNTGENGIRYIKALSISVIFVVITWIIIVLTGLCIATFITAINREMSWYTNTTNIIWLYILPPVIMALLFHYCLKYTYYKGCNTWNIESLFYEANMLIWCILLLILTYYNIASAYGILVLVLCPLLLRNRLASAFKINYKERSNIYFMVHVGCIVIPASLCLYLCYLLTNLVLAIMGRSGTELVPDRLIAIVIALPLIVFLTYHSAIVYVSHNIDKILILLSAVTFTGIAAIIFTSLGFPFSSSLEDASMQRAYFTHYDRIDHKLDMEPTFRHSYLWHTRLDYQGFKPFEKDYPEIFQNSSYAECDGVFCGMPFYLPLIKMLDPRKTLQIPAERLVGYPRAEVKLINREKLSVDTQRLTFQVTGPDHMTNFLMPRPGVSIQRWSLEDGEPLPIKTLPIFDQPTYYIYYSYETKPSKPWQYSITIHVNKGRDEKIPVLDYSAVGHFLHGSQRVTPALSKLSSQLPPWTVPTMHTATVDMYEF